MQVYLLFETFGDGDSYTVFNFVKAFKTAEDAVIFAGEHLKTCNIECKELISENMTPANNYTLIVDENDTSSYASMCQYGYFGGLVIRLVEVV
jgi:hypothetical protein